MPEGHGHSAAGAGEGRLRIVLMLTATVLAIEVAGGLLTNSLALLADAGHMLADVAGIGMALAAIRLARRPADQRKTFGYYRLEMLAALANGAILAVIAGYILFESYLRIDDPPDFDGPAMLAVAVATTGLVANLAGAWLLFGAQKTSLNLRGAYLEVIGDMAGSVAVIAAGLLYVATGFGLADVIASVCISLFVLPRAWGLMGQAIHVLLEGAPGNVDIEDVRGHILDTPGVIGVHDLHVWNLTSGVNMMSAHVVVSPDASSQAVLEELSTCLDEHFDIEHSTFQIESPDRSSTERAAH